MGPHLKFVYYELDASVTPLQKQHKTALVAGYCTEDGVNDGRRAYIAHGVIMAHLRLPNFGVECNQRGRIRMRNSRNTLHRVPTGDLRLVVSVIPGSKRHKVEVVVMDRLGLRCAFDSLVGA